MSWEQPKENLQGQVPGAHAQRVRGTVAGMQRLLGGQYTLSRFLLDATREHCDRLEREHHDGQPWPPMTKGELPRGARIGASADPSRSVDEAEEG